MIESHIKKIVAGDGKVLGYKVFKDKAYSSQRYNKSLKINNGDVFDGATSAIDIDSFSWAFHDVACRDGCWSDGDKMTNWQASMVLSDILKEEGRWFRAKTWFAATFLFGGGKARNNGLFK